MKIYKGTQRKINLVGSDEYLYLINNIVEDLENKFGKFCHCDCVDGNITIDKNIKGLVIFNANKLEPSKFKEINSEIRNNKSSGKFYILQSSEPLEYLRDQTFKVIKLPAYTHICELPIMIRFLAYMIKKIFEIDDAKKIARLIINPRIVADFSLIPSLNDLVNELQELNSGNSFTFVDYNNRDFWFDYECYLREKDFTKEVAAPSINPINNGKFSSVESKEQQYNPDKTLVANEKEEPIIPIEFTHHKGEDKWEINYSENKEPIEINYKNKIGIKYLVYLAKHCSSKTNAIRADELLKIVKDWDGKVVKEREEIPTKTPEQLAAGRIKSAINTSFVNRSKKLKNRKIDPYETQNQKKLEGLNLGNDYDTKTTYSLGKDIECFYYERRSNYVIDKIIDEDNEILFPPD
jgi:hypothetical protein